MPFISYAQNAEDVPLWRVFRDQPVGFYIDVGASGPEESITRAFYNRGWTGINLEPAPHLFEAVRDARRRDINLQLAASDRAGTATLYTDPDAQLGGLSTLLPEQSEKGKAVGFAGNPVTVPTDTLAAVCVQHVGDRQIDFLKIDVEGHERLVIVGADWTRWRPRIVVVEATEPMLPTPSHHDWEPLLLAADYRFAVFDGLNRFYVRAEDAALLPTLSYPPCVFDEYVSARHAADLDRLRKEYADLQADRDAVWWQLHHMRVRAEAAEAELAKLRGHPPRSSSPTR